MITRAFASLIGAIAGVVATGPMTVAMIALHRRLPRAERYPLPPREITSKIISVTGAESSMSGEQKGAATLVAHFAYGAAGGALYGCALERWHPPVIVGGFAYGAIVWLTSYLGLLPGTGILRPAIEHPARRNALMLVAHFIWGVTLAWFAEVLLAEARPTSPQPFSSTNQPHRDRA